MGDGFLFRFKRLEALLAVMLPSRNPASVNVFADASDARLIVAGFFSRSASPLAFAKFFEFFVAPALGIGIGGPNTPVSKSKVLGMLLPITDNADGPTGGFARDVLCSFHEVSLTSV